MVWSLFDTGLRQLQREKEAFESMRRENATVCIQRFTRWLLRRKRTLEKMAFNSKVEATVAEMEMTALEARNKKIAFQQNLREWYRKRKEEHDKTRMLEEQTARERTKIASYRRKKVEDESAERVRLRGVLSFNVSVCTFNCF